MGGKLTGEERIPREQAAPIVKEIDDALHYAVSNIIVAGSFRRQKPTVADIEFVVADPHGAFFKWCHANLLNIRGGTERISGVYKNIQIDFEITPLNSLGAALLYFTGSRDFNIGMRGYAKKRGLKLNQRGLYVVDMYDDEEVVASESEESIFDALDIEYIMPPDRDFFNIDGEAQNKPTTKKKFKEHQVPSMTNSDQTYKVKVYDDGSYAECNCPDFKFRRRARGEWCKHIKEVMED